MIQVERYGLRADGNPVIETSTYLPVAQDHPLAVQLDGHDGWWVRVAVGNSFTAIGATEVTKARHEQAKEEIREIVERNRLEAKARREQAMAELDAKKNEVRAELAKLGLSQTAIKAILDQVRQG